MSFIKKKQKNRIPLAKGERSFEIMACIFCIIITVLSLYPIYYIFIAAFSNPYAVQSGQVLFTTVGFTTASMKAALEISGLWSAYGNTLYYTVFGVLVNMIFTTTMAYALSKKRLLFRKQFNLLVVFTMWFNAGILPFYITLNNYNMLNSRLAILFAFAINAYNLMVMRSFFEQIPEALEEAAVIDGASNVRIFTSIYLPLSKPALITVGMFYVVTRWNNYFWTMVLITDDSKIPLQVLLKKLIVDRTVGAADAAIVTVNSATSPTTIIYAVIIIAIVPMLILYPFVQKYFKTGATLGAVKG